MPRFTSIDSAVKQQIADAYRRLMPDCKNESECFAIIAASLGIGTTTVAKYKDFIPDKGEDDLLELPKPIDLVEIGRGKRVEATPVCEICHKPQIDGGYVGYYPSCDCVPKFKSDAILPDSKVYKVDLPLQTSANYTVKENAKLTKTRTELLGSDFHFPFEDKPSYGLFLKVAKDLQPDILCLLGDIADFYAVSAHDKDPNRATPSAFKSEIGYIREKLKQMRDACPDARMIFKSGNHETRLERYINKNAAALKDLDCLSIKSLLGLDELNIEYVPNEGRLKIGKLHHIHGNEVAGGGESPARLKYRRMGCNFVSNTIRTIHFKSKKLKLRKFQPAHHVRNAVLEANFTL
jgi:hypothetical protein